MSIVKISYDIGFLVFWVPIFMNDSFIFFSLKKDVVKLIHRNKDEQSPILDLSKNNVTIIPTSLKEVTKYNSSLHTVPPIIIIFSFFSQVNTFARALLIYKSFTSITTRNWTIGKFESTCVV